MYFMQEESKTEGFTLEVLDAFCHEPKTSGLGSYCTDYFVDGLLNNFAQVNDKEVRVTLLLYCILLYFM